jgi:hypothetical protein
MLNTALMLSLFHRWLGKKIFKENEL